MGQWITHIDQATPGWLTEVLREAGYLDRGRVTGVQNVWSLSTPTSSVARLELRYSADSPGSAPERMFLKVADLATNPDLVRRLHRNELEFYRAVSEISHDLPVVRCYVAAQNVETGRAYFLLEDLSETHTQMEWPLPPSRSQCEQVVDCLARCHAFWWENARLEEIPNENILGDVVAQIPTIAAGFLDFLGDRFSAERRGIYEHALAALVGLWEHHWRTRIGERRGVTLAHGDSHFWQFMYPHDEVKDRVYLIDWQVWHIGLGADDLAYMIALRWYPERRQQMEGDLLRRYHDGLLGQGVEGYSWEDFWMDYRMGAIRNLFVPAVFWSMQIPAGVWWSHLERAMLAFQDLNCAELLDVHT